MKRTVILLASVILFGMPFAGQVGAQQRDEDRDGIPAIKLTYREGTSGKLEQVIGDCDWTLYDPKPSANPPGPVGPCKKTLNQTITRNEVMAHGFGYSFEHNGRLIFLFGDTVGGMVGNNPPEAIRYGAQDTFAWSTTRRGEDALLLNYFQKPDGTLQFVSPSPQPSGAQPAGIPNGAPIDMGGDDIPNSGISLNGQAYVIVNTNADGSLSDTHLKAFSVLARYNDSTGAFTGGRTVSQSYYPLPPGNKPSGTPGHFVFTDMHEFVPWSGQRNDWSDTFGPQEPVVMMFGNGQYRQSSLYLSYVPEEDLWTGTDARGNSATRYFTGLKDGQPTWSQNESDAVPVFYDNPTHLDTSVSDPGTVGNSSVSYSRELGLWILTYDGGRVEADTTGIYLTYAKEPWGPWATPQLIYNACRDRGFGDFIFYYVSPTDTNPPACPALPSGVGPAGPVIGAQKSDGADGPFGTSALTQRGGPFAPLQIERFMEVDGDTLRIFYILSTFNPYTILKMESDFKISFFSSKFDFDDGGAAGADH